VRMANIPAGEVFFTPEDMVGTFIGDVVISLDQSYMLSADHPLVVKVDTFYKVLSGPKEVIKKLKAKKKESWELLRRQEKAKSAPKSIINLKRNNFNRIGEFAINTNPAAKLCNYLIVNEKIAHMIHIALGSGFDADRASAYHTDIVIDAPKQKLNIVAVSKGQKTHIMKAGRLVL
jgi:leucyl aminopeptidase (aminopeptidase T)